MGARLEFAADQEIVVGRDMERCRLALPHCPSVSRQHCRIRYDGERNVFYLMDISTYGTFLMDGAKVPSERYCELAPGTRFYLTTLKTVLRVGILP